MSLNQNMSNLLWGLAGTVLGGVIVYLITSSMAAVSEAKLGDAIVDTKVKAEVELAAIVELRKQIESEKKEAELLVKELEALEIPVRIAEIKKELKDTAIAVAADSASKKMEDLKAEFVSQKESFDETVDLVFLVKMIREHGTGNDSHAWMSCVENKYYAGKSSRDDVDYSRNCRTENPPTGK